MLVSNEKVDNLYKLIDGLWLRTRQCPSDIVDESVIGKLVEIKEKRGWKNSNTNLAIKAHRDA